MASVDIGPHPVVTPTAAARNAALDAILSQMVPLPTLTNTGHVLFADRNGTFDNTTQVTFQATFGVPFVPVAVRMIIGNAATGTRGVSGASVCATDSMANANGTGMTWTSVTFAGAATKAIPARAGANRYSLTVSDRIAITPIKRTDGPGAVISFRDYEGSSGTINIMGDPLDSYTNWPTRPGQFQRRYRSNVGNCSTTGTVGNFTSTTDISQSPILGFIFELASGELVCTMRIDGDSIASGQASSGTPTNVTYRGEGFLVPAVERLNTLYGKSVTFSPSCGGWAGTASSGFGLRLGDAITATLPINVSIAPFGSPNDVPDNIIEAADITADTTQTVTIIDLCNTNSIASIIYPWLPTNPSVKDYNAYDVVRRDGNDPMLNKTGSFASKNYTVMNLSTVFGGAIDGDNQQSMTVGTTTDGIHPNDYGNLLASRLLVTAAKIPVFGIEP